MINGAAQTYRFVRLSLIAALVAMLISIGLVLISEGQARGSVSAYYYSPARSVVVGALCAIGLSLVALHGRRGAENLLLNLAGLVMPVVAIVPTPVCPGDRVTWGTSTCPSSGRQIPAEFLDSVMNNSWAAGATALMAMTTATIMSRRRFAVREVRLGLASGWLVVVGFGVLAIGFRSVYVQWAHYLAAFGVFGCITAVVLINAHCVAGRDDEEVCLLRPHGFRRAYRLIGAVMVGAIVVAVVGLVYEAVAAPIRLTYWVLVVELVLLAAFGVFWVLQTAENWTSGRPAEEPPMVDTKT